MTVSLIIWIVIGVVGGVGIALAFKQNAVRLVGNVILCTFFAVAGGWLLGVFGLAIGGPYVGAAVNAAIGVVLTPIVLFIIDCIG
jgi:hypothetical protein